MRHVGIIGGGASGMMAAVTAASCGAKVTILEHTDRIGRKILSTGNGKCNFTNLRISEDDYFGNHPSFVTSALSVFGPEDMVRFLEDHGILTQEKRDGCCYPHSGQAGTILDFFTSRIKELGITVRLGMQAEKILRERGRFIVDAQSEQLHFDSLIMACGGRAAQFTGSDGSGFSLLRPFQILTTRQYPTLAPLPVHDPACRLLAGVRAPGTVTLKADGEQICTEEGEIQFNKDTLSGIPVFQLTHAADKALAEGSEVTLWVDFLPRMSRDETRAYIGQILTHRGEIVLEELLAGMVHKKAATAILHRLKLSGTEPAANLTEKQLKKVVSCLHQFVFTVTGMADFDKAQATMGGVLPEQVDENMMVKKTPGMYIVGEMLDVDGRCGGYNLQWAWTSGYIAGRHAAGAAGERND